MSSAFLWIDEEPLLPDHLVEYLQSANQFQAFLLEILRQHAIARELKANPDLTLSSAKIDQIVTVFREINGLKDEAVFQTWMQERSLDADQLRERVARDHQVQQLILQKSDATLGEYFMNRKLELDQVWLSCIVVATESRAQEFRDQLERHESAFEDLARDYSLADNRHRGGKMEPLSRADLPPDLRSEIDVEKPGALIGPLCMDNYWYLFRLEDRVDASLEGTLETQLRAELFGQWLATEVDAMTVKVQVTKWLSLKTSMR